MGTGTYCYVSVLSEIAKEELRGLFPNESLRKLAPFLWLEIEEFIAPVPEKGLLAISTSLGCSVHWLQFQSAVEAFVYHHWDSGKHLRTLVYGIEEERTWERAEGAPEPWEREAFFSEKELERSLRYIHTDEERTALRDIWKQQRIETGSLEPPVDAKETALLMAQHYHFPGWE